MDWEGLVSSFFAGFYGHNGLPFPGFRGAPGNHPLGLQLANLAHQNAPAVAHALQAQIQDIVQQDAADVIPLLQGIFHDVFAANRSWGRVAALLAFLGELAVTAARSGNLNLETLVLEFLLFILRGQLGQWIVTEGGGTEGFLQWMGGSRARAPGAPTGPPRRPRFPWWSLMLTMFIGGALAAILLALLTARRHR
ncbi:Bcl-like protein [Harp seal herpesvirus]|uniref:Bcl-like protein n=1 Tax=phocid gammaherpesvirus 3 TaxID=2560643 RepID=A0A0R5Z8R0_9GAMA|nr:Bcl-like protein [Harp seal herpesvirus]AJG42931.1 Bcl-like protein [Harp seal herpesvirus]